MDLESWLPSWLAALLPRRRRLKVAVAREKGKNRSGTFTVITFGAAGAAFTLALFGIGPFAVQEIVASFSSGQIPASEVFPAVSPTIKTITIYSPPPRVPGTQPQPSTAPRPAPNPTPVEQEPPEPGDNN